MSTMSAEKKRGKYLFIYFFLFCYKKKKSEQFWTSYIKQIYTHLNFRMSIEYKITEAGFIFKNELN